MDREGSREDGKILLILLIFNAIVVTMIWREHQANPDAKPGPDFRAMNKMAAVSGLTSAKEQPAFRSANQMTLKTGEHHVKKASIQSARSKSVVYGTSSSYRNAETVRAAGPDEPPLKHVIQGAYQMDWVGMNMARADSFKKKRCTFQATPTKASIGHIIGARQHMEMWSDKQPRQDEFKLSKFKRVPPKVTEYNGTMRRLPKAAFEIPAEEASEENVSAPEC
ncbi:hypothetical protein BSKO_06938 [Bryopsis sp. KO-2023]|nr:hypothetical protein BSKO_06938 [Bryopsis sp. KO-2023]